MGTDLPHHKPVDGEAEVSLPVKIMLYTLDQVAYMLSVSETQLVAQYLYFPGRSVGPNSKRLMTARNIAPTVDDPPEWRVTEREIIRYCKVRGIQFHQRGWATF